jgi:nucleotide-binding universal stress UspA family protein
MTGTVVVGYDGQDRSDRVLDRAIERAKTDGVRLVVVVAEDFPPPQYPSVGSYDSSWNELDIPASIPDLEHPLPGVQEIIDRARMRMEQSGVTAEYVWGLGDPALVIVDAAREHGATQIMIGAHHHGFFDRLVGGDVDAEVQRLAECEVVLVD